MNKDQITIPLADDLHVHLRQEHLMQMVVPLIRKGGIKRVLVMPNLKPVLKTTEQALNYQATLQTIDSEVEYLMTLYLNPKLTTDEVKKAKHAGIMGIKSYPRGVTTNSESGIENYEIYNSIFAAMEELDLILNLHGEIPSNAQKNICILNAEEEFLIHLQKIHEKFPRLRIVLEHVTTTAAIKKVKELGATVAATITAHHLDLTVDDWAGKNHNFCKPVAKYPSDREALRTVVKEANPKFFLGSDSAPHLRSDKENACACAGVFTTPLLLPYLADTLEKLDCLDKLKDFCCTFGRQFYNLPEIKQTVTLKKSTQTVPEAYDSSGALSVIPYRAGEKLNWCIAD
jgi:dihydroorotase